MDYKEFFTKDNKNGAKTREEYLNKHYPEIYKKLKSFILEHNIVVNTFREEVYYFMNNITEQHKCLGCGSDVNFRDSLNKGYTKYCSLDCANNSGQLNDRAKQATLKKYGVESTNQLESVKDKKKLTYIKNYGVDNPTKYKPIRDKQKETLIKNYGVDSPMKSDILVERQKNSTREKYGVDNPFQSEEIKEKIKKTNLKNLGVEYPSQSKEVKDKTIETNIRKFGVPYTNQSEELVKKLKNTRFNNLKDKIPSIIRPDGKNIIAYCDKCNSEYSIGRKLLNVRFRLKHELCTICNNIDANSSSKMERDIFEFMNPIIPNLIERDRKLLNRTEIDILSYENKIGVEIDGIYFHSEVFKVKNYHINKTNKCEKLGFKLIHIFEDEWEFKPEIVKSNIKYIFGISDYKFDFKNCFLKEISKGVANDFINENHIEGESDSDINIGLYDNEDTLIFVLSIKGNEIVRYANKLNHVVIDGLKETINYYVEKYKPNEITTYVDRRWSQGKSFEELGFDLIEISKPNYFYVDRKNRIINVKRTQSTKFNKIYDCGTKKYKKSFV